jgi:hypothetical protein
MSIDAISKYTTRNSKTETFGFFESLLENGLPPIRQPAFTILIGVYELVENLSLLILRHGFRLWEKQCFQINGTHMLAFVYTYGSSSFASELEN